MSERMSAAWRLQQQRPCVSTAGSHVFLLPSKHHSAWLFSARDIYWSGGFIIPRGRIPSGTQMKSFFFLISLWSVSLGTPERTWVPRKFSGEVTSVVLETTRCSMSPWPWQAQPCAPWRTWEVSATTAKLYFRVPFPWAAGPLRTWQLSSSEQSWSGFHTESGWYHRKA